METLGGKIRQRRQQHKLTLAQLSKKTGLSKGFLSQIERNLSQPSITSLKKIAIQLGISVVNLSADDDNDRLWEYRPYVGDKLRNKFIYNKDIRIVPADRRKSFSLPGSKVTYELLTPDMNRQLEIMYLQISEGETSGDEPMIDPPGEKCGIVLQGTIEVRIGDEVYQLEEGTSICYPSDLPHWWRGLEGDPIKVIWVLTPPSF
jgi:transcriptional regulator with XRE-family HTH domain